MSPAGKYGLIAEMLPELFHYAFDNCLEITGGPTYQDRFAWIAEKGLNITGSMRVVYLNDPMDVPPEEILTEIYAPVD
ncbi:MAG: GyrI-like domain-containing protein [Halobacteriota archaeon]